MEKIAVLIKCESDWDKVFATIPENRRGTFTWSRSYPCMGLHQRDNPNKIGSQTESYYRDAGYTMISAADYLKEGEVEEFKVGDRVKCIDESDGSIVQLGKVYAVTKRCGYDNDRIGITGFKNPIDESMNHDWAMNRFKLTYKPKTTKENKTTSIPDDEYFEKHKDELCESCKDLHNVNNSHPNSLCEGRFCNEMLDTHKHDNPNEEESNNMNINSSIRKVFVEEDKAGFDIVEKMQKVFGGEIVEDFTGAMILRNNKPEYIAEIKRLDDIETKRLKEEAKK